MKTQLIKLTQAAVLGGLSLLAAPASAYQAGDFIVRAGAAGVLPTGDGTHPAAPGPNVEADDGWSLGLTATWMATNNIGVGVLAAWPFEHDIETKGGLAGTGDAADTKHLPPTVTMQYHFNTTSKLHPYIGAGINYTNFFSEDTNPAGALSGGSIKLDDSWGLALEVGADYELQNNWLVSAQVWYIDIDTDATVSGLGALDASFNVEIDPWVVMIGVGKKF
ncbi:MAG TPA: OmpW family outer membrane protein [Gammaproteobacteria bacterium]|jgi:outer membrane protein|nr:OmpW family outer membrane protein [Gammaproteobacteria bacterium]